MGADPAAVMLDRLPTVEFVDADSGVPCPESDRGVVRPEEGARPVGVALERFLR